jgi:hypothetical protein
MSWAQLRKKRGTGEFSTGELRLAAGLKAQANSGRRLNVVFGSAHAVVRNEFSAGSAADVLAGESLEEQQKLEHVHLVQR